MWVIAVYDCPVTEADQRHDYTQFRRKLLQENFSQLQYSLYARHFPTMEAAQSAIRRISVLIPEESKVAFFQLTDKQFGMTKEFFGAKRTKNALQKPEQVEFF